MSVHFSHFALILRAFTRCVPNGAPPVGSLNPARCAVCCASLHPGCVPLCLAVFRSSSKDRAVRACVCLRVCVSCEGLEAWAWVALRSPYRGCGHASLAHCHPEAWRAPGSLTGCNLRLRACNKTSHPKHQRERAREREKHLAT